MKDILHLHVKLRLLLLRAIGHDLVVVVDVRNYHAHQCNKPRTPPVHLVFHHLEKLALGDFSFMLFGMFVHHCKDFLRRHVHLHLLKGKRQLATIHGPTIVYIHLTE